MPEHTAKRSKRDALKRHGTLNPHPGVVTDPSFRARDFFDPDDLVQVKYEMLRHVQIDRQSVSATAKAFGFSRPSFYQAESAFRQAGLSGLLPQKRGPRAGHKLTAEIMEFIGQVRASDASLSYEQLAQAVRKQFGVSVHSRSIDRQLRRQKKPL